MTPKREQRTNNPLKRVCKGDRLGQRSVVGSLNSLLDGTQSDERRTMGQRLGGEGELKGEPCEVA